MQNQLEQAIFSTIVYFDLFDYPLTLIELERFLLSKQAVSGSVREIDQALGQSPMLQRRIRAKDGFCYLRGREGIVEERRKRYRTAGRKWKRACRVARVLSYLPFVRAIFVSNSLAIQNTKPKSDIDLVIITRTRGVWWARFCSLFLLHLLRMRPKQGHGENQLCLSMFIDEGHLDIGQLRLADNDIDFAYWVLNFYPLYDAKGWYRRFWNANIGWFAAYFPNARPVTAHKRYARKSRPFIRKLFECLLVPFSFAVHGIQQWRFPERITELANVDSRVRIEDGLLKFHVNDRRQEHLRAFVKRYEEAVRAGLL